MVAIAMTVVACGSSAPTEPEDSDSAAPAEAAAPTSSATTKLSGAPRVAAAGDVAIPLLVTADIADCSVSSDEKVADLVAGEVGKVALPGDLAYESGTKSEFAECFDPAWGPIKERLRPSPGNHEYYTDGNGYFDYFGDVAGTPGKGWYAYNLGEHWRAISLNSNCGAVGGCTRYSPQGKWLHNAIENAGSRHILAYWHSPRFSSGQHGNIATIAPFWRQLYNAGAAIVLNGHDHNYERFAPQAPDGTADPNGIREFVVGTGGRSHYPCDEDRRRNSRVCDDTTFGALRLRLLPDGYRWRFLPINEGGFTDSGSHDLP